MSFTAKKLSLKIAAQIINKGGVVIYPTETFYGLAADPLNTKALNRIFQIKGRAFHKPLPLIISDSKFLKNFVKEVSPKAKELIQKHWPGALSLIFKTNARVSPLIHQKTNKVMIRQSPHPQAQSLAALCGGAIISTSANFSHYPPVNDIKQMDRRLIEKTDGVLVAQYPLSKKNLASTIVDATKPQILVLRQGLVKVEWY